MHSGDRTQVCMLHSRTLLSHLACCAFSFYLNQKPQEHENLVVDRDDTGVILILSRKSLGTYLAACKERDNSSLLSGRSGEDICRLSKPMYCDLILLLFFHGLIQNQKDIQGPCV